MFRHRLRLLFVGACVTLVSAPTVSNAACSAPTGRPAVGLVLSGGGALGASHIGVLKVLEELRVPVDCIAGTSMGAIVGGLYATGLDAPTLERIIAGMDWREIFTDNPPRRDRDFRRKIEDENLLLPYRIGIGEGPALPRGIVLGQQLNLALKALAFDAVTVRDFDQLAIPFRAVAADIETGEAVIIGAGDLGAAMRASMAVSGVFPPVDIDGRLLVDGGLVNNLPIDVARNMGADVVIVADIPSELSAREDLGSAEAIIGQSISLMILRSSQLQIDTLTADDVLLEPDLQGFTATSFNEVLAMIPRGEAGARAQEARLSRLSLDPAAYSAHVAARRALPRTPTRIASVRIENNSGISDDVIAARLTVNPGDEIDLEQIEDDVSTVYGLDYFETVTYRVDDSVGGEDEAEVVIVAEEQTIGLSTARLGLNLQYDLENGSDFIIGGQVRFAGLDDLGAELLINGGFGQQNELDITYLQPLDAGTQYYIAPQIVLRDIEVSQFQNGDLLREIGIQEARAGLGLGWQLSTWGLIGLSGEYGVGRQKVRTGPAIGEDDDYRIAEASALFRYDTVDNTNFPIDGEALSVLGVRNFEAAGAENNAWAVSGNASTTNTWGRNTVRAQLGGGGTLGDDNAAREGFRLGGFLRLSGYPDNGLAGDNFVYGALLGYRRLNRQALLFDMPLYVGGSVETATIWNRGEGLGRQRWSGSVFAGAETPIGPLYLGYGVGGADRHAFYFNLGRQF